MAEIIQNEGVVPQRGKRRAKRLPARIDMTPMVDLACLLLTFFMLTTAFTKPKIMEIIMPRTEHPQPIPQNRVLNVILAENNQVFFYNGLADPTENSLPTMIKSDLSENGLRKVLLERNKKLFNSILSYNDSISKQMGEFKKEVPKTEVENRIKKMKTNDKSGPIVLVKAAEGVKYGNIVDVLNELAITNTARYAVVNINNIEKKMLQDALSGKNVELQN